MSLTITQNVVTGSRSLGTVFQNTSGSPILVEVIGNNLTSSGVLQAFCDSAASPTTLVSAEANQGNNNRVTVVFLVPDSFFYKVTLTAPGTLNTWTECNFTAPYATAQTNVTGSRSLGTIFQNTSGKVMFVEVVCTASAANSTIRALNGPSSPPGIPIAQFRQNTNTLAQKLFFIVPDGYYYEVTTDVGSTLNSWIEITVNSPLSVNQYTPTQLPVLRSLNTNYKASLSALIVSVSTEILGGVSSETIDIATDTSSNPSTFVNISDKFAFGQVVAAVPLNSFYRSEAGNGASEYFWTEWALDISVATPNVHDGLIATEALVAGVPASRVDILSNEVLVAGTPNVHDGLIATEALVGGTPKVRVGVLATNAVFGGNAHVRCQYLSILAIVPFVGQPAPPPKLFVQAVT